MKTVIKLSLYFVLLMPTAVYAEVITDGSLGASTSLSGAMQIPQSLGTTTGNNLFHSFNRFNINTGESATFTGNNSLANVISRVTGGQVSLSMVYYNPLSGTPISILSILPAWFLESMQGLMYLRLFM